MARSGYGIELAQRRLRRLALIQKLDPVWDAVGDAPAAWAARTGRVRTDAWMPIERR